MTNISEELRSLLPATDAPDGEYPGAFRKMAELLLNRSNFMIQGIAHRFTEIEFYFKGYNHVDTFTHGDKMQHEFGIWYFHKMHGEYKSGSYKGMDLAIGNKSAAAGILIRGVERIDNKELIDGPSMCVDNSLNLTSSPHIRDLVAKFDISIDDKDGSSPLYMSGTEDRKALLVACPRVGLTLKRENAAPRWKYIARNYRFVSEPSRIKKGKFHMAIGLHQTGKTASEISKITGAKESSVRGYIDHFETGKAKEPKDFAVELGTDEMCELFGACQKYQRDGVGSV